MFCYEPGEWLFACPTVTTVFGWERATVCKEEYHLPPHLDDNLPGGHEHEGNKLYHSRDEALKALAVATASQP